MSQLQIAFYKGRSRLFNKLTSWWLRGLYSHCELVLGVDQIGRSICASSSFLDGGVRVKHMVLDPEHWDVITVQGDEAAAWQWLRDHDGEPYDLLGVAGFIARRVSDDKTRWFCSEAVAAMLGMPDPWRQDPCSLWSALSRPATQTDQPAPAGIFTPGA